MFRSFTKKRSIVALSIIAVLALAGGAYAYFTSSGSGTGAASVGTSSLFTVNPAAATGGPLYPGSGSESISYTVTNPSSGAQNLSGTTAAIASSGGNITHNGTPVAGCLASWFTATNTPPTLPQNLAGGATSTAGSVAVTMSNAAVSQNACQNQSPDITISAS
ncbi:MAG: SurA N-terminal domain-containing protein [Actinomycetota bacterium]|nr:SurA N-terminal domain-containing protein [Actinomycetota bacterium]